MDFDTYDDQTRKAVALARAEVRRHGHDTIHTAHLLLGVLGCAGSKAFHALRDQGVTQEAARLKLLELIPGKPLPVAPGQLPLTHRAKAALCRATAIATTVGSRQCRPHHLLLALNAEPGSMARKILEALDVDQEKLLDALGPEAPRPSPVMGIPISRVLRVFEEAQLEGADSHELLKRLLGEQSRGSGQEDP